MARWMGNKGRERERQETEREREIKKERERTIRHFERRGIDSWVAFNEKKFHLSEHKQSKLKLIYLILAWF